MSKSYRSEFIDAVWQAVAQLGTMNAPQVTDYIIEKLFPETVLSSKTEGVYPVFRNGLLTQVRQELGKKVDDEGQMSIFDVGPAFRPYVEKLKRGAYYVESLDEYVSLPRLIKEVTLLDDARKYMRKKGEQTLMEAGVLDQLYKAALSAANDNTPSSPAIAA